MKIKYEFVTGETVEIEVSDEWGEILVELGNEEKRNNHTETRRHYKLDVQRDDSECLEDSGLSTEDNVAVRRILDVAENVLTKKQFNAFEKVCIEKYTEREYAKQAGVSHQAVDQQVAAAKKKIRKYF